MNEDELTPLRLKNTCIRALHIIDDSYPGHLKEFPDLVDHLNTYTSGDGDRLSGRYPPSFETREKLKYVPMLTNYSYQAVTQDECSDGQVTGQEERPANRTDLVLEFRTNPLVEQCRLTKTMALHRRVSALKTNGQMPA